MAELIKEVAGSQLADGLTKKGVLMDTLLKMAEEGRILKI